MCGKFALLLSLALAPTRSYALGTMSGAEILDTQTGAPSSSSYDPSAAEIAALTKIIDNKGIDLSTLSGDANPATRVCEQPYTPDATTQSGHKIRMLGAAIVYWTPTMGRAVLGHLGERFSFCRDTEYFDVSYDYTPFDQRQWNDDFEKNFGVSRDSFNDEQKRNLFDSLFVNVQFDPASNYAIQQYQGDRSIYEAWIKADGGTMYRMMVANVSRYDDQLSRLRTHQPLPPYKIPSDDCMTPVLEDYNLANPGYIAKNSPARLTPGFFYNAMRGHDVDRIIFYPSQRQFRLLVMKAQGQSTAFEWFMPTSSVSGDYPDSWALIFPGTHYGLLRYVVFSPLAGAVNLVAALAETAFGALTAPLTWLGVKSDDIGVHRFERGLGDMIASTLEIFSFQMRYPTKTDWTPEEKKFIQDFTQHSVLLKYLDVKYKDAPLLVNMKPPASPQ